MEAPRQPDPDGLERARLLVQQLEENRVLQKIRLESVQQEYQEQDGIVKKIENEIRIAQNDFERILTRERDSAFESCVKVLIECVLKEKRQPHLCAVVYDCTEHDIERIQRSHGKNKPSRPTLARMIHALRVNTDIGEDLKDWRRIV